MATGFLALPRSLSASSRPLLHTIFAHCRPTSSSSLPSPANLRSSNLQHCLRRARKEEQRLFVESSFRTARARTLCCSTTAERLSPIEQANSNSTTESNGKQQTAEVSSASAQVEQMASREQKLGAFQQLPMVSPANEILVSALRRAKMVKATKGIVNAAKRERNKGAKQLDALIKELTTPLRLYLQKFPQRRHLHAYERALLELTLGDGMYEEVLARVDLLRKKILDLGKNYASLCAKSTTKAEAEERLEEGFSRLEELFKKQGKAVDDLKEHAKTLRAMPVVRIRTPTLCLVGAPNVGKSSLVRILSSGKPEVCNYPFTTRGISMGHFEIESRRFQVTDTPGLLKRPDDERNNIEKLTIAALAHLPTSVLYVHDLTGECGTTVPNQFAIYNEMRERFADRPWLDVVSKADLLPPPPTDGSLEVDDLHSYALSGPKGALWVSVYSGQGIDELVRRVHSLLLEAHPVDKEIEEALSEKSDLDSGSAYKKEDDYYFPAWPRKQVTQ
ncbi:nucleolar GTP-binding protein [Marchantia polymorpha subsp. ruderalis]|uniref:OBG-type G domain-containing protein n=2 Tax=Marchantia polymorpha TaxID=3197 RepID=A0A176WB12_MARPO|nr:hypothetical protein AXG93_3612s1110 [Marchantia polymorpha subsp. ruderalis]PTQ36617.1 hypothetical protein MARPO_0062s0042 [Marchantia polymorpha]PTQ36618.1 hypothetical protein MARPO_0062s0042 [Marchantia polymorpha]PTQ36619.1 hypothetical protein MARPO_0062s0042 [Marchantia polymorpha]BBN16263.1 hypothetical protein Mp_7g04840 [Marchantia polymorpha subsp. ruderalis]|eukprot:PTQ36617.1 hypothetical protein MARPO_0062s0042 [Marchantia polymorpha]